MRAIVKTKKCLLNANFDLIRLMKIAILKKAPNGPGSQVNPQFLNES